MRGISDIMRNLGYNITQILNHLKILGNFLSFLIIQVNNNLGKK